MLKHPIVAAGLAAILLCLAIPSRAQPDRAEPDVGPPDNEEGVPDVAPPTGRLFGPHGFRLDGLPFFGHRPTVSPPETPPPATADAPDPVPPTRQETFDRLFARLAKTTDPDEASGIAALIERMWMQSGSDTADLLMSRAMAALELSRRDVAMALLDKVVTLDPEWAEAWNKRATLRFLDKDDIGAMEDINQVLKLEPRHFGALSGMSFILRRNGMEKAALAVLRRVQGLYPENPQVRTAIDKLVPDVEGRDL